VLAGVSGWRAASVGRRRRAGGPRSGALRSVALHAPFGLACLAVLVATAPDPGAALIRAWAGGAGYFALTLHWIVEPFMVDAARHGWMAPFALVCSPGVSRCSGPRQGGPPCGAKAPVARALAFAPLSDPVRGGAGHRVDGLSLGLPGTCADRHALACGVRIRRGAWPDATGGRRACALGQLPDCPAPLARRRGGGLAVLFLPLRPASSHAPAAAPTHPSCA
jgi:hypothetical protein